MRIAGGTVGKWWLQSGNVISNAGTKLVPDPNLLHELSLQANAPVLSRPAPTALSVSSSRPLSLECNDYDKMRQLGRSGIERVVGFFGGPVVGHLNRL
jgi:hypothetical protein